MRSGTIAWLLGTLALHQLAGLAKLPWGLLLGCCALFLTHPRLFRLPLCFLAGFLWTGWCAHTVLAERPPAELLNQDIQIRGTIVDLPKFDLRRTRFEFSPEALLVDGEEVLLEGIWRLNWYQEAPALKAGQRWQLKVRLKPPRQFLTKGSFDYQRYLFRNRIGAVGYVRNDGANRMLHESPSSLSLDRLRGGLAGRIATLLADTRHRGVIAALVVGVRHDIESATGELLRRTGTAHLMAISGLHIAIAASLGFFLGHGVWRLLGQYRQRYPARKLAALGALLTAAAYAALAGFSLPTQRALVMLIAAVLALLSDRGKSPSHVFCWALLATLLWDPLAPLDGGFWLSFGAVAALILGYTTRLLDNSAMSEWFRIQCLLTIALLPLMVAFFGVINLATLPANLIAVPWAAVLIVPFALLGGLLELLVAGWGAWPWQLAESAFAALHGYLVWLDGLQLLIPVRAPSTAVLGCTVVGVLLLLAPRGFPGRWLGLLCLPMLVLSGNATAPPPLRITVFDTGRSYSTILQTPNRVAVLDTGPKYSADFSFASSVLVPHLRSRGVRQIDALVNSRPMASRVGGSRSLLESFKVAQVLVADPSTVPIQGATGCDAIELDAGIGITIRALRTLVGTPRCQIIVTRGNQEIAVLDPDTGMRLGLPGEGDSLPSYQTSQQAAGGILPTYEYALGGHGEKPTWSAKEQQIRYWHY